MALFTGKLLNHLSKDFDSPWGNSGGNKGGKHRPDDRDHRKRNNGGGGGGGRPPKDEWDDFMRKNQDKFKKVFGGGDGGDKKMLGLFTVLLLLVWVLFTGVYIVETEEQGVVTRFGEFTRTTSPGIHLKLPYPIEQVYTPEVTTVNKVEVGFRSGFSKDDRSIPEEALMLTGDENIVDINFEVQWKIDKADHYLFNVSEPDGFVKGVAESAMREVIGQVKIMSLIAEGEGRKRAIDDTRVLMQRMLDEYQAGIYVDGVNLLKADPPAAVIEAFRDVQSARADMETARNQAEAYRNDIIPRARGQAEQMLQQSEAYRQEVIARAEGEASRFGAVFTEYRRSPKVIRDRMYLEAMEDVYSGMNKVIVGEKANGVLPFLPLHQLAPAAGQQSQQRGGN